MAMTVSVVATPPGGAGEKPRRTDVQSTGAASWTPWLLSSPDQFRLVPPPANRSPKTKKELRTVLRRTNKRTKQIRKSVRYWNRGPVSKRWTETTLEMIRRHRPRPAQAARILALVHNALFDALIASYDSKAAYDRPAPRKLDSRITTLLKSKGSTYPPPLAVLSGAAEAVLTYSFPNESPTTFKDLATEAVQSRVWAGVNYPSDVKRGRRMGREVGALFVARASGDGSTSTGFSHPRPEGEEYWETTPPGFEDPVGGPVGFWQPWVIPGPNEIRIESGIPGPYPYGSDEFMAELEEVMDVADNLTSTQQNIATFWDDGPGSYTPPGHWNEIALELMREHPMGTKKAVRLFSYLNTAEYDTAIAYFDAKYFWWSIRPITVIRRLCDGGSVLCTKDELTQDPSRATYPDWFSYLITPNFPSYPSGHSSFSGAGGALLEHFFPGSGGLLNTLADEAAMSRLYGGIHFRSDNDDGLILGRTVAEHVLLRASGDGSGL